MTLIAINLVAISQPDEVKAVRKSRKIDMEVMDLKLKLYNNDVQQLVLSNREIRLLRYLRFMRSSVDLLWYKATALSASAQ